MAEARGWGKALGAAPGPPMNPSVAIPCCWGALESPPGPTSDLFGMGSTFPWRCPILLGATGVSASRTPRMHPAEAFPSLFGAPPPVPLVWLVPLRGCSLPFGSSLSTPNLSALSPAPGSPFREVSGAFPQLARLHAPVFASPSSWSCIYPAKMTVFY